MNLFPAISLTRRKFLAGSAGLVAGVPNRNESSVFKERSTIAQPIRINVDTEHTVGAIPPDFVGLGFEISSVARSGLLSANNRVYVQLLRTLGAQGVIRIGGNTSDYSLFAADRESVSAPKSTVVNEANLKELGTFLDATGWKLIWGLNLGSGTEQQAVSEAQAVAAATGEKLLAFEIGNEPDLFGRRAAHRATGYSYADYLEEYRRYKAAIRAKLPNAPFAGPDAASATDWVVRFAADEGKDLKLLTHHYYRECANPTSTLDKLLHPDPKLAPTLEKLSAASESSHVPWRMCETNSFCGGGKPGVSDTFGSALWVLDYMFTLTWANAAGVNIETGVNQLGFISSYSPIGDDEHGTYSASPDYYGMLAFSRARHGRRVALNYDAGEVNLNAYAVLREDKRLVVTIINKDMSRDADVRIVAERHLSDASALRLVAPSIESKAQVTLGGSAVASDGAWKAVRPEPLRTKHEECEIRIPAASAAIVDLRP